MNRINNNRINLTNGTDANKELTQATLKSKRGRKKSSGKKIKRLKHEDRAFNTNPHHRRQQGQGDESDNTTRGPGQKRNSLSRKTSQQFNVPLKNFPKRNKFSLTSKNPFINFFKTCEKHHPKMTKTVLATNVAKTWYKMTDAQKASYEAPGPFKKIIVINDTRKGEIGELISGITSNTQGGYGTGLFNVKEFDDDDDIVMRDDVL